MPRQRTRKRWEHPTYKFAYCIERNGIVYTIIDGAEKVAIKGLIWDNKNKAEALKILDERLTEAHKVEEVESKEESDLRPKTLYEAVEEFSSIRFTKFDKATIKSYMTAFKAYLVEDLNLADINRIRAMIRERQTINKHAPNTQLKYLSKLNKLFEYCIDQEYISRNPILKDMKPDEVAPEVKLFTQDELNTLFDYFFNLEKVVIPLKGKPGKRVRNRNLAEDKKQFAWMIKFISMVGTRAMETINIWWDVPKAPLISNSTRKSVIQLPERIIIDGKRSRRAKPRVREFPLQLIPQVYEVIQELEKYKDINKGKLFKWNSVACLELWMRDALQELELEPGRNLHALRKTAINWWEKELGIPLHVCNYMAGHNQQTRDKYYGSNPTALELVNMSSVRFQSDSILNGNIISPQNSNQGKDGIIVNPYLSAINKN